MKILFVGDVMLGRLVNEVLKRKSPEYPWGDTLPIFRKADVRICNLECVISDRGEPWGLTPKVFHFRSDAKNVEALKRAGITAVSLANNHTLDYGYEAMFDMLKILDRAGIKHAGAGRNLEEASRPAVWQENELRIGFIAFTDNEPQWEVKEDCPGIFYVPIDVKDRRAKYLFDLVRRIKKSIDFLIVSAHGGPNWGYQPQPEHIPFAHALIDAGADIIFGHSCHVFQGIEIYKGRPILYSTGDFIDDYAVDEIERNDESFTFIVEMSGAKIARLQLYPTVIRDFQALIAKGSEARRIAAKMQELCAEFHTRSRWDAATHSLQIFS